LEAEMRRVDARTEKFEQESMENANQPPPIQPPPTPAASNPAPSASVEERLKKLDSLYKQGLLSRQEYETKRSDILKDL